MDEITLNYIRTSLKKNPEEWFFREEVKSSSRVPSTLNIFYHEPTDYILTLVFLPAFTTPDLYYEEETYFVDLMSREDYEKEIGFRGGNFKPKESHLHEISSKSVIVKTLLFIKNLTEEDEQIVKYSNFKSYIDDKYELKDKEVCSYGKN